MARTKKLATLVFAGIVGLAAYSNAADYSSMTTEELSRLRGTMQNATQSERDAFHAEWLERVEQMTPTERQSYMGTGMGPGNGTGRNAGMGSGNGPGDGSGTGNGSGGGMGNGPGGGGGNGHGGGMGNGGGGNGHGRM